MKNKKIIGIIVVANFAVGLAAFAQNADQPTATEPDAVQQEPAQTPPSLPTLPSGAATVSFDKEKFLKDTAQNGMAEVNMAQIGTQKAEDPALKEAAQKLVADHSKLNDQLKEIAQKKGITLSTELDPKHKKMLDHISGLSGAEFDKAFATHMAQGHKKSIAKFKQAAANTEDAEISQLATATLPTLKEHLTMIQKWAPDTTSGAVVEEPAGAEIKSEEPKVDSTTEEIKADDAKTAPDYKSTSDQEKSDLP